jgi:hypothetical protein
MMTQAWRKLCSWSSRSSACNCGAYQQAIHAHLPSITQQKYDCVLFHLPLHVHEVCSALVQMRADREAKAKTKAEAKQKAQQEASKYVPVDKRKLPSPVKKWNMLEEAKAVLQRGDKRMCQTHSTRVAVRVPLLLCSVDGLGCGETSFAGNLDWLYPRLQKQESAHLQSSATARETSACDIRTPSHRLEDVDSGKELQATDAASDLRAQLLLKDKEIVRLQQEKADLLELNNGLKVQNQELQNENKRLTASLAEAQCKKKVLFRSSMFVRLTTPSPFINKIWQTFDPCCILGQEF